MMRRATPKGDRSKGRRRIAKRRPAARRRPSSTELQKQLSRQALELAEARGQLIEALDQQTATSEVLKVISGSPGDLQPVFQAMLENAVRLCGAKFGLLFRFDGDFVYAVATVNVPLALLEFTRKWGRQNKPIPGTAIEEIWKTKAVVQRLDDSLSNVPTPASAYGGARSWLGVPMLKDGQLIGALVIYRQERRPFEDKQIKLLSNFADQAVIAIENTRLLSELRRRTDDLAESLEQQTATSEVLKVISSTPGELQPVFDTVLAKATALCEASYGALWLCEGDAFRTAAFHGALAAGYLEQWRIGNLFRLGPAVPAVRATKSGKPVQEADLKATEAYRAGEPLFVTGVDIAGIRTILAVPMLKDGQAIGVIAIYRKEVRPFADKQIELLQNFAAQAVIAIENTRLLSELRQRTDDLTESLEQQTATSEVLKVISSSPGDLGPVFDALLSNALHICEAKFGNLLLVEGAAVRMAAQKNSPEAYVAMYAKGTLRPGPHTAVGRVIRTKQITQIDDIVADARAQSDPLRIATADLLKARTLLAVPMLKDDELIGVFVVYRQEVRPFTQSQIELLQNFAAQAVIAIENTRLLNELRESLQQQTATADVLKVISSSPGDLKPVFQAMLENAVRICEAQFGNLALYDGRDMRVAAMHNPPPAYEELRRGDPVAPAGDRSLLGVLAAKKEVLRFDDLMAGEPSSNWALVKFAGARAALAVPMLKEDELVGAIVIYRTEASPFSDKQVELLTNFAAQAVIAIENTRLLNELRQRTDDLSASLERQTATAGVLQVISGSPTDVHPVFDMIARNAARLCKAQFCYVFRYEGGLVHFAAQHGYQTTPQAFLTGYPIPPGRTSAASRSILNAGIEEIPDVFADPDYGHGDQAKTLEYRSIVAVPMLKDGRPLGTIALAQAEAGRFPQWQIELLRTFADQAVIAIENARLLNELHKRTDDLTEALEQQTATSEVLKVISRSAGDLMPVFEAMLENAVRICGAKFGTLFRFDGEKFHTTAFVGAPPDYVDYQTRRGPFVPPEGAPLEQLLRTRDVVRTLDMSAQTTPVAEFVQLAGTRSHIAVPMLREGELVGAIVIYNQQVQPFTDKQVELVQNFAAQAVIAIENTRLLNELRQRTDDLTESLEQQTATSELLRVIASSPTNLQPVLDAVAETAARVCGASDATIRRIDCDGLKLIAHYGEIPSTEMGATIPLNRGTTAGRAIVDRQTIHLRDLLAEPVTEFPTARAMAERYGFRTALSTPLLREGVPTGAIMIRRTEVRPFTDSQIKMLETFAAQAVIAIENTRLFQEVKARTDELSEALQQQTATANVLKVISRSTFDLETVLNTLLESAAHLCEAHMSWIFQQDGQILRWAASYGHTPEVHARVRDFFKPLEVPVDRGSVVGRAASEAAVVHIPDVLADPEYRWAQAQRIGGYRAGLGVPLLREGKIVGVLFVAKTVPKPFTEKQIELATTFADQAVIAIENTRLLNELRESLQQQTATTDVLKIISRSTFDLQVVLDTLTESAARLCEADMAAIVRQKGEAHHWATSYGFPAELSEYLKNIPVEPGRGSVVGRILIEGKTVHVPDALTDPDYTYREAQRKGGYRTMLGVPLLREGMPIGIVLLMRGTVKPFTDKQIELASTFADQAVIAIENVRLFDEVQAQKRELTETLEHQTATSEVLSVISRSPTNAQPVFEAIAESAARLCEAVFTVVWLYDGNLLHYVSSHNFTPEVLDRIEQTFPKPPDRSLAAGRAILDCTIAHVPDMLADPMYAHELAMAGNWRASVAVPMLRDGRPVGAISVGKAEAGPFTERQMQLLTTFADQAVIAIQNVRLFEAEQQRTRQLTRSLEDLQTAQDRLVQTQKLASLGQLTAGIAHEIKNPLNFVNNFSSLSTELIGELQDALQLRHYDDRARAEITELMDTLRANLEKIEQHGKRADSIVKNMLLHSREGSGEHRPVDINSVVEESLNLAYHGARAEKQGFNVTLVRSFDPAAGEVDVFPQDITRVLLNLISNGFYAASKRKSEAGDGYEPTVSAATRNLGDRVEIRIRDNGTGIPPEVREKMFNPFFTTKPPGEGTGLGLSLSHDIIVKQHAGVIEVETQPGSFTEFKIILPRAAATIAKDGSRT